MKRPDDESCDNCRFSAETVTGMICRRHAPTRPTEPYRTFGEWPITIAVLWCGEWAQGLPYKDAYGLPVPADQVAKPGS